MNDQGVQLSESYLKRLVEEFTDPDTVGVLLVGSYARGDASRFSDIDLMKFVNELPPTASERYVVRFDDQNLICVTVTTVGAKLDELKLPEKAMWAAPGLRQARILTDSNGAIAALKRTADDFAWSGLQVPVDAIVSHELAGLSEESHKVLSAWLADDRSAGAYAMMGLLLGLTKVAALKLGVMIPTENDYFRAVREAVGPESEWSTHHTMACDGESLGDRMSAALSLYLETARLIGEVKDVGDSAVIGKTVERIERTIGKRN